MKAKKKLKKALRKFFTAPALSPGDLYWAKQRKKQVKALKKLMREDD